MDTNTKSKLWNKDYIFIFAVNLLASFSFYMVATILTKYITGLGGSVAFAGSIAGLFSITSLIARPLCGYAADRFNKVLLLKVATLTMSIGLIGYTLSTNMTVMAIFRIVHGIGFAINGTTCISFASDFIPEDRMSEGVGYLGIGQVIASAVAPGVGIAVIDYVGIEMVFYLAATMSGAAFLLLFSYKKEERKEKHFSRKIIWSDLIEPRVMKYTLVGSVYSFINGVVSAFLLLHAETLGITGISAYFTVCAVFLFISRPVFGRLSDKHGLNAVVIPALAITFISMIWLGRAGSLLAILLTGVLRSIGQGAAHPAAQAAAIRRVGKEKSGVAVSTFYLGGDIGQGIGPIIGGYIAGLFGYGSVFRFCGYLVLFTMAAYIISELAARKNKELGGA